MLESHQRFQLLQDFRKGAVFPLLLTKFSFFLKSTCLLLANFLKFIFNQKEERSFIWSKTFGFVSKPFKYLSRIFVHLFQWGKNFKALQKC